MSDPDSNQCKGCSASVRHPFAEIEAQMPEYIQTIDPADRVSDEVYRRRLEACHACPALYYESTCMYCGCYIRMRALRSNKDCPCPEKSRWNAY
jgi:hypothetical protein